MLDKSKPYGEIYGGVGACFEQNNKYYSGQGHECDLSGELITSKVQPKLVPTPDLKPVIRNNIKKKKAKK